MILRNPSSFSFSTEQHCIPQRPLGLSVYCKTIPKILFIPTSSPSVLSISIYLNLSGVTYFLEKQLTQMCLIHVIHFHFKGLILCIIDVTNVLLTVMRPQEVSGQALPSHPRPAPLLERKT